MTRKMSKRQRALQNDLDELLELCRLRGIGSQQLRQSVHDTCTRFLSETLGLRLSDPAGVCGPSAVYEHEVLRAAELTAAGVTAQLSFLREAWGAKKLRSFLESTGGILDAIVRHTSSDPEALKKDIGRDNVDANGDVI